MTHTKLQRQQAREEITKWNLQQKGKTWEEIFGKEKAKQMKKQTSERFKDIPKTKQQKKECLYQNLGI